MADLRCRNQTSFLPIERSCWSPRAGCSVLSKAFCLWGNRTPLQGASSAGKIALHSPQKMIKLGLCPPPKEVGKLGPASWPKHMWSVCFRNWSPLDHSGQHSILLLSPLCAAGKAPQGTLYFRSLQHTLPLPNACLKHHCTIGTREIDREKMVGMGHGITLKVMFMPIELSSSWIRSANVKLLMWLFYVSSIPLLIRKTPSLFTSLPSHFLTQCTGQLRAQALRTHLDLCHWSVIG